VFTALGDPTRRQVLELLRESESSVSRLTEQMSVSQSAVSQHLKVLTDAGLVQARSEGTRRVYRVRPDGLAPLRAYVERFWDDVLDAFTEHAANHAAHEPEEHR
jgi:DNA-binding transcriptional ArsR family regulator